MLKIFFKLFLLVIITLAAGEIALRFIPSSIQYPLRIQFSNEDGIGVVHPQNISVINRHKCYGPVRYTTNSWGMRDIERSLTKKDDVYRVAILGDSMMDAEQVNDEEVMSRALEDKFNKNVEFLNFGMNAVGPMQESILYDNKVRKFKPDLVILMFYTENDIENNSISLEKIAYNNEPFLIYRDEDGNPYSLINFTYKKAVKQFLVRHFALFRLAKQINSKIKYGSVNELSVQNDEKEKQISKEDLLKIRSKRGHLIRNEVFITPPDEEWENAWHATKKELLRLRGMVEKDNAELLIVLTPAVTEFDPSTPEVIADEVFNAVKGDRMVDIFYPYKRIKEILADNGFLYFDLYIPMQKYIKENKIGSPYFSYSCNSHWSKLGHKVAADELYNFLKPGIENNDFSLLINDIGEDTTSTSQTATTTIEY